MAQTTAYEVAEMESNIAIYRNENEALRRELALVTSERDALRVEVALTTARAQEELVRSTEMHTIISQVSAGLVAGLQKMHSVTQVRKARREEQERALDVGGNDPSPVYKPLGGAEAPRFEVPQVRQLAPQKPIQEETAVHPRDLDEGRNPPAPEPEAPRRPSLRDAAIALTGMADPPKRPSLRDDAVDPATGTTGAERDAAIHGPETEYTREPEPGYTPSADALKRRKVGFDPTNPWRKAPPAVRTDIVDNRLPVVSLNDGEPDPQA